MKIYSVSELTREIKEHLELRWPELWVQGEISNLRPSQAGHFYFSLKDSGAQIRMVLFRGAARSLKFAIEEGLAVVAMGHLSVYEPRGEYQIIVESLEPQGLGALQLAFEQLKKKLEAEGLFQTERKRPIPFLAQRIGIVTSPTGAAIQDMIQILSRRFPTLQILIAPVLVQGREAAGEIAEGIRRLNEEELDLLIVGRGGGSVEDLWAFNEEIVARAIFESRLPVISAVGHETDFTIADFVADLRAPTPSAAAELAVPLKSDLLQEIVASRDRLQQGMTGILEKRRLQLRQWIGFLRDPRRHLETLRLQADSFWEKMQLIVHHRLGEERQKLHRLKTHLGSLNPHAVLDRGYAVATLASGKILRDSREVSLQETVNLTLARGKLRTKVLRIEKD